MLRLERKVIKMKSLLFSCLLFIAHLATSQEQSVQEDINKDIWYNFMQAYQDLDASLFNQIHTSNVLRVIADADRMLIGQEYKDQNLEVFNRWNAQEIKQKIEFSFYKRVQKANWAYEIGIYKLTRYEKGQAKSFYGKFNVTLKKESGAWKIHIDSDTSEEGSIGEEDFLKGSILK